MLAETQALEDGRQGVRSHTRSTHTASLPRTSTRSDLNISHSLGDGTRVPSPSAKLAQHTGRLKLLLPRSSSSQNQVSYFSVKTREGEKRFRLFTMLWEFWGSQRKLSQLGRALCSQLFIFSIFFPYPAPEIERTPLPSQQLKKEASKGFISSNQQVSCGGDRCHSSSPSPKVSVELWHRGCWLPALLGLKWGHWRGTGAGCGAWLCICCRRWKSHKDCYCLTWVTGEGG